MKNNPAWIILIISIILAFIFAIFENSSKTSQTVENKPENKIVSINKQTQKEKINDKNKKEDIDKNKVKERIFDKNNKEDIDKSKEKISDKKNILPPTNIKPAKEELVKIVKEKKKTASNKILLLNDYKKGEESTGKIESHSHFVQKNKATTTVGKFDIKKDITIVIKNKINDISNGKVVFESFIESGKIDTKYGKKIKERNIRGLKEHKIRRANLDEFIYSSYYIKNNAIPEMPSKEIGIGDTWKQDLYTEVVLDKKFIITYDYKLTKFTKINGKECAEISVTANQNNIKEGEKSNVELKVNGLIYCDKSNGRIIKYDTKLEAKVPVIEKSSAYFEGSIINKFEMK